MGYWRAIGIRSRFWIAPSANATERCAGWARSHSSPQANMPSGETFNRTESNVTRAPESVRPTIRLPCFLHALQRHCRVGVGLLKVNAPIAQRLQRNVHACHGAEDERAGLHDAVFAVEIFDL